MAVKLGKQNKKSIFQPMHTIIFEPMFPPSILNTYPGTEHDNTAVELIVTVGF